MLRKCIGKLNIPNFIHDFGDFYKKIGDFQCLSHLYGFIDDSPVHF